MKCFVVPFELRGTILSVQKYDIKKNLDFNKCLSEKKSYFNKCLFDITNFSENLLE
jgi:hypothetical protein